jgi:hypothetical protein
LQRCDAGGVGLLEKRKKTAISKGARPSIDIGGPLTDIAVLCPQIYWASKRKFSRSADFESGTVAAATDSLLRVG